LDSADVRLDGDRPWDVQVHNDKLFARVLSQGSLGLGESYMDGWWDCERLDEFFYRVLRAQLDRKVRSWPGYLERIIAKFVNLQTPSRAFHIGKHHYDIGNDLYQRMLGRRLIYSCAFWENASSLDEAQEAKLDLVCRKLGLEPGMRVLDIGCGWGGTARYAAERYGVEVVGVTVSEEQASFAKEMCRGLPIEIRYQDYRSLNGTFDRILSLGMFEHVGPKNYATFMDVVRRRLKEDGLFLLHTIGVQEATARCDPWIARYIFPNSKLPSAGEICGAVEGRFVVEHWQNLGAHYDRTLMHWFHSFQKNWRSLCDRYDEKFFRMWTYYLLSCAGVFRARANQLWQVVLSPRGVPGGYRIARDRHEESSQRIEAEESIWSL
jgi:cyclopropane-fatty-acyl-phospholipid synthase